MKYFFLKLLLFLTPFVLVVLITQLFVPMNGYYFRFWEALQPKRLFGYFSGPFYPSIKMSMKERGDLAPHTDLSVVKEVVWQTDKYGYRTSNTSDQHEIIIIGDSNIVGTGVTQEDILSEVVERKMKVSVYPYAPKTIEAFLQEKRFIKDKPKVVVFAEVERSLSELGSAENFVINSDNTSPFVEKIKLNKQLASVVTLIDRSFDPLTWLYAKRLFTHKDPNPSYVYVSDRMLFLQGEEANSDIPKEKIKQAVDTIISYNEIFKARGIKMIFLPIPNKENIYYKMMPTQKKPTFLKTVINELKKREVIVVDTQSLFEVAYEKEGFQLYHYDDTHWNSFGVKIAADGLIRELKK
jgi:hypothetical protein